MVSRRAMRKVGLRRIDAALEALRQFGFSDKVIVKTIDKLLSVYDGDGWVFIEEASYKLVIDTILEEQETCSAEIVDCGASHIEAHDDCSSTRRKIDIGSSNVNAVASAQKTTDGENVRWKDVSCVNADSLVGQSRSMSDKGKGLLEQPIEGGACLSRAGVDNSLTQKRNPCYGWISDDEAELDGGSVPEDVKIVLRQDCR